jgi:hypothetical protein
MTKKLSIVRFKPKPEHFDESVQSGVEWLDKNRLMLQEYDPVNRHTIPLTGDLVE